MGSKARIADLRNGFRIIANEAGMDRLVVRHVAENSLAALAGLHAGDQIVAIDGRAVDRDYPSAGERQGEKPAGTRIDMTLSDGRSLAVVLADYF